MNRKKTLLNWYGHPNIEQNFLEQGLSKYLRPSWEVHFKPN